MTIHWRHGFMLLMVLAIGACSARPDTVSQETDPEVVRMTAQFGASTEFLFGERLGLDSDLAWMEYDTVLLGLGQGPLQDGQIRISVYPTWGDTRVMVFNTLPNLASGAVFQVRRGAIVSGHAIAPERIAPVATAVRTSGFLDGGELRTHRGMDGEMIHLEVCLNGHRRRALLWCPIDAGAIAILQAAYRAAGLPYTMEGKSFSTVQPELGDPVPGSEPSTTLPSTR